MIASGHERDVLPRLLQGETIGTLLTARALSLDARKQWLADHLQVSGKVMLDAGAVRVLRNEGKSLLSIGVTQVSGEFQRGAVVAVLDTEGRDIARGLVNYSADEARRIAGKASGEIEHILGYVDEPELIHRDNRFCCKSKTRIEVEVQLKNCRHRPSSNGHPNSAPVSMRINTWNTYAILLQQLIVFGDIDIIRLDSDFPQDGFRVIAQMTECRAV